LIKWVNSYILAVAMSQEPKKKHSKAYKRTRRAAIFLTPTSLSKCANCNADRLPHIACPSCGFYKGTLRADALKGKPTKAAEPITVTKA
jgi:large subunit ribosomal protein L32